MLNQKSVVGFVCGNCHKKVFIYQAMGTSNRNHCPFCLWSKHVDAVLSGDRKSICKNLMKPIGLTFKQTSKHKYEKDSVGEVMLVHQCVDSRCRKVSINRIAADDDSNRIMSVFRSSLSLSLNRRILMRKTGICLLDLANEKSLGVALFGKGGFGTI